MFDTWDELLNHIAIVFANKGIVVSVCFIGTKWQINYCGPLLSSEDESELVVTNVEDTAMTSVIWEKSGSSRLTSFSKLFTQKGKLKKGLLI